MIFWLSGSLASIRPLVEALVQWVFQVLVACGVIESTQSPTRRKFYRALRLETLSARVVMDANGVNDPPDVYGPEESTEAPDYVPTPTSDEENPSTYYSDYYPFENNEDSELFGDFEDNPSPTSPSPTSSSPTSSPSPSSPTPTNSPTSPTNSPTSPTNSPTTTPPPSDVNSAPEGHNVRRAVAPNKAYIFKIRDFGFDDPNDDPKNTLQSVKLTVLPNPSQAEIRLRGIALTSPTEIDATDIIYQRLRFVPKPGVQGFFVGVFAFQVRDNGGTEDGGIDLDQVPKTFSFRIVDQTGEETSSIGFDENGRPMVASGTGGILIGAGRTMTSDQSQQLVALAASSYSFSRSESDSKNGQTRTVSTNVSTYPATYGTWSYTETRTETSLVDASGIADDDTLTYTITVVGDTQTNTTSVLIYMNMSSTTELEGGEATESLSFNAVYLMNAGGVLLPILMNGSYSSSLSIDLEDSGTIAADPIEVPPEEGDENEEEEETKSPNRSTGGSWTSHVIIDASVTMSWTLLTVAYTETSNASFVFHSSEGYERSLDAPPTTVQVPVGPTEEEDDGDDSNNDTVDVLVGYAITGTVSGTTTIDIDITSNSSLSFVFNIATQEHLEFDLDASFDATITIDSDGTGSYNAVNVDGGSVDGDITESDFFESVDTTVVVVGLADGIWTVSGTITQSMDLESTYENEYEGTYVFPGVGQSITGTMSGLISDSETYDFSATAELERLPLPEDPEDEGETNNGDTNEEDSQPERVYAWKLKTLSETIELSNTENEEYDAAWTETRANLTGPITESGTSDATVTVTATTDLVDEVFVIVLTSLADLFDKYDYKRDLNGTKIDAALSGAEWDFEEIDSTYDVSITTTNTVTIDPNATTATTAVTITTTQTGTLTSNDFHETRVGYEISGAVSRNGLTGTIKKEKREKNTIDSDVEGEIIDGDIDYDTFHHSVIGMTLDLSDETISGTYEATVPVIEVELIGTQTEKTFAKTKVDWTITTELDTDGEIEDPQGTLKFFAENKFRADRNAAGAYARSEEDTETTGIGSVVIVEDVQTKVTINHDLVKDDDKFVWSTSSGVSDSDVIYTNDASYVGAGLIDGTTDVEDPDDDPVEDPQENSAGDEEPPTEWTGSTTESGTFHVGFTSHTHGVGTPVVPPLVTDPDDPLAPTLDWSTTGNSTETSNTTIDSFRDAESDRENGDLTEHLTETVTVHVTGNTLRTNDFDGTDWIAKTGTADTSSTISSTSTYYATQPMTQGNLTGSLIIDTIGGGFSNETVNSVFSPTTKKWTNTGTKHLTTNGKNDVDIVLGGFEPRSAGPVQLTATVSLIIHDGSDFNTLNDSGLNSVTTNPSNTDGITNSPNGGWKRTGETNFNSTDSSFAYTANGSASYSRSAPGESASGTGTVDDEFTTTTLDSTNKVLDVVHNTFVTTTISDKSFTIDNSTTSTGGGTYTIPFDGAPMSGHVEEETTDTMYYSNSEYKKTELTTSANPPPPASSSGGTNPPAPGANAPVPTVKVHTGLMTMSMVSSQSYSRDGGGAYLLPDGTVGTVTDTGSADYSVTYIQGASINGGLWITDSGSQTSAINSSHFHSDISDLNENVDSGAFTNAQVTLHKSNIRDHSNSVITTKTLASDGTWSGITTTTHTNNYETITDETGTGDYAYLSDFGVAVTGTGTSTNKKTYKTYETETEIVGLVGNPISHTGTGATSNTVEYTWEISGGGELELNPPNVTDPITNDDGATIGSTVYENKAKLTLTETESGSTKTTHSVESMVIEGTLVPKEEKHIVETTSFSLSEIVDYIYSKETTNTDETVDGVRTKYHGWNDEEETITDRISTDTVINETETTNRLLTAAPATTTSTTTVKKDDLRKVDRRNESYENSDKTENGVTVKEGNKGKTWRKASDITSSMETVTNGVTTWIGHVEGDLDTGRNADSWPDPIDETTGAVINNSEHESYTDNYYAPAGYDPPPPVDVESEEEAPPLPAGVILDDAGGLGKFVDTDPKLAQPPTTVPTDREIPVDAEGNPIVTPLPPPPTTPPTSLRESTEAVIEEKEEEMTSAADTEKNAQPTAVENEIESAEDKIPEPPNVYKRPPRTWSGFFGAMKDVAVNTFAGTARDGSDEVMQGLLGAADSALLTAPKLARELIGNDKAIPTDTDAYKTGETIETAVSLATGIGGLVKGGAKQLLKQGAKEFVEESAELTAKSVDDLGKLRAPSKTVKCFAPETPVQTNCGVSQIDDVQVGQSVKAFDFRNNCWVNRVVLQRHDNNFQGSIFRIRAGGQEIVTTAYHPFWVVEGERLASRPVPGRLRIGEDEGFRQVGRWVSSNDLLAGDVLITIDGKQVVIEEIHQRYEQSFRVVNLSIETNPSFAVGVDGILIHNVSDCDLYQIQPPAPKGVLDLTSLIGKQATISAHLPAGSYTALVVDGQVYVARMHNVAWELAGGKGVTQFYGFAEIDALGRVVRLFK